MFTPNIDEDGADARRMWSRGAFICSAIALVLPFDRWVDVTAFLVLFAAGLIMRFEAKRRWCVLRACGIKTTV